MSPPSYQIMSMISSFMHSHDSKKRIMIWTQSLLLLVWVCCSHHNFRKYGISIRWFLSIIPTASTRFVSLKWESEIVSDRLAMGKRRKYHSSIFSSQNSMDSDLRLSIHIEDWHKLWRVGMGSNEKMWQQMPSRSRIFPMRSHRSRQSRGSKYGERSSCHTHHFTWWMNSREKKVRKYSRTQEMRLLVHSVSSILSLLVDVDSDFMHTVSRSSNPIYPESCRKRHLIHTLRSWLYLRDMDLKLERSIRRYSILSIHSSWWSSGKITSRREQNLHLIPTDSWSKSTTSLSGGCSERPNIIPDMPSHISFLRRWCVRGFSLSNTLSVVRESSLPSRISHQSLYHESPCVVRHFIITMNSGKRTFGKGTVCTLFVRVRSYRRS